MDIGSIQKSFLHIALGNVYLDYENALVKSNLETLEERRTKICLKFAKKSAKHPKHRNWFVENHPPGPATRSEKTPYISPLCRH